MNPEKIINLTRRVQAELDRAKNGMIRIDVDVPSAMALLSQLQLAVRHPHNTGQSAAIGRRVAKSIEAKFQELGLEALAEVARLGWDPTNDLPVSARKVSPIVRKSNPSRN